MTIEKLVASQLYHATELDQLPSKSTKDLPPIDEIVGQVVINNFLFAIDIHLHLNKFQSR